MRLPSTFDRLLIVIGLFLLSIFAALQFLTWPDTRSDLQRFVPAERNISTVAFNARQLVKDV
jgi:uncharacterized membrane protein